MTIEIIDTKLVDAKIIIPKVFADKRGFFTESYSEKVFYDAGIKTRFIQDNHSLSIPKGVLRGMHFQTGEFAQTKLIRIVTGAVLDVIVDIRKGSPSYKKWQGFELSEQNKKQLLVPKGFAHGFLTLTDNVNFLYKCDNYYNAKADSGIIYNDETLGIDWEYNGNLIISDKDKQQKTFLEFEKTNPFVYDLSTVFI
jgi:dTDP-4-dehydrorhamnose 3,5-epimerase